MPDQELCQKCNPDDVDGMIAMSYLLIQYLYENGPVIKSGQTLNPGGGNTLWRCVHPEEPLTDPPRHTMRWFVDGAKGIPEEMLADMDKAALKGGKKNLFKRK